MSKANHARSTSAKRSATHTAALSKGVRGSPPENDATAAALPIPASKNRLELQLATSLFYEAQTVRGNLKEGSLECDGAEEHLENCRARLNKVCDRIWSQPALSLSDLYDMAEMAFFWAFKDGDGHPKARSRMRELDGDRYDYSSARLIQVILQMGGANV